MLKTEYLPIEKLKLNDNNPRMISDDAFARLCDSIKENPAYFEARPILCSNRTGENVIIGGNMRYRAAKHLGMAKAPVIVMAGLTEAKEKELIIRDNVSDGQWDFEILANDFEEFNLAELGLEIKIPEFSYDKEIDKQELKNKCPKCGYEF